jgi:hypothetical protein
MPDLFPQVFGRAALTIIGPGLMSMIRAMEASVKLGVIAVVIFLGGCTVAAGIYGVTTWQAIGPTVMGFTGWFTLILMVVLTLGLGFGLMGLMFYSNRKGYDDNQDLHFDE